PVFLVNSRFSLVSAALPPSTQGASGSRPPFFQSYGGILPNSLTTIHSIALVFSTQPPESVWGTGGSRTSLEDFLDSIGSPCFPQKRSPSGLTHMSCGRTYSSPYTLGRGQPSPRGGYLPVSPHRLTTTRSGHAFHPHTRTEVLLGGFQALSITDLVRGGSTPVPEYQPDVHRLRLSASP